MAAARPARDSTFLDAIEIVSDRGEIDWARWRRQPFGY
jgi:hypothetical protein